MLVGQRLPTVILFPPSRPCTQGLARGLFVPRDTGSCYLAVLFSTVGTHVLRVSQVNSMLENTENPGLSWCWLQIWLCPLIILASSPSLVLASVSPVVYREEWKGPGTVCMTA